MNEENKQIEWLKYLLAILALVALTILFHYISGDHIPSKNLLLELIPELMGSIIIFIAVYLLFIRKGIFPVNSLEKTIVEQLILDLHKRTFGDQSEVDKKFNFKEKLKNAKEIRIIAYSAKYLITQLRNEIAESIITGTNFKILFIDRNSLAFKLSMENSFNKDIEPDIKDTKLSIEKIQVDINHSNKKSKGKLECKEINWIPSCSLILWKPKNNDIPKECKVKINSIYPNTLITKVHTHAIIYENRDKELFDYFSNQFDELWEKTPSSTN